MVETITQDDFAGIGTILNQILSNDNAARKAAEEQLNVAKSAQTDKYACLLSATLHPNQTQFSPEVKSLAAVILRRNISTEALDASDLNNQSNNENLWKRLSDGARTQVKTTILECLQGANATNKVYMHKVCNVAVEIQGAMVEEQDENIWQDLLNILFTFI
jgi:hypothetical protein